MKALLSLLCGACAIPTGPIALSDQLNPTARSPEFAPLPSSAGERAERSSGTSSCQANGCNGCWIHGECDPLDEPGNLAYSKVHCETGAAYCGTLGTYCGPNVLNTAELQAQLANSNAALANSNAELEIPEKIRGSLRECHCHHPGRGSRSAAPRTAPAVCSAHQCAPRRRPPTLAASHRSSSSTLEDIKVPSERYFIDWRKNRSKMFSQRA